jgi:hypothetical protein
MDPLSALKNEVFRPLAAVVMPGILAIAPFAIMMCNAMPEVLRFYEAQPTWFLVALAGAGTTFGLLLENVGSSIERGIDRCMDVEYMRGNDLVWAAYLSSGTIDNNGRRFLGTTVTRLKFINSLMPSAAVFALGIVALQVQVNPWNWNSVAWFLFALLLLLTWLFRTSTELSEVASNTRYYLLDARHRPATYNPDAATVRRTRHFAYVCGELITSKVYDIDLRGKNALWVIPVSLTILFPATARRVSAALRTWRAS